MTEEQLHMALSQNEYGPIFLVVSHGLQKETKTTPHRLPYAAGRGLLFARLAACLWRIPARCFSYSWRRNSSCTLR